MDQSKPHVKKPTIRYNNTPLKVFCLNLKPMRPSFFHHLHPTTIPAQQARWRYTLGAGGLAFFLTIAVALTGLFEMFYYIPTPAEANASISTISFLVPFGALVRNMHYLASQILVIVSAIHLLRVIFTGAYTPPRRFNYLLGLMLFVLILFLDFTGYTLRWDNDVHWAIVAGTNLVESIPWVGPGLYRLLIGGSQPGGATLVRFYTWHIYGLMLTIAILMGWHLFKVRRDGGIAVPPPALRTDPTRITRFELVRREALAMIIATIILVLLSAFIPAPIGPPINFQATPAHEARAPWFFLWIQQLLKLGDPFLLGVLLPLGILVFLALIPYILPLPKPVELGHWFPRGGRLAQIIVGIIAIAIIVLTLFAWFGKQ